jgi:RND family efflux transporter MFP subunit
MHAGVALALSTLALGCRHAAEPARPARPVRVEGVHAVAETGGLRYSASIEAHEQVPVAFKTSGYVRELQQRTTADGRHQSVQQGGAIARGAVLARVHDSEYRERVNAARAQSAAAQAVLEKAQADAGRAQRLYDSKSLTRPDYDAARTALASAEASAQSALSQLETAEVALRDCALIAPLDGIVLARQIEVGALAAPGTVGFVVADITSVKAMFGVPDRLAEVLKVGLPLVVTSEALGDKPFKGRISAISPDADVQSRSFTVEVTVANPDRQLRPGMIAAVEVPRATTGADAAGLPTVPLSAIVKGSKDGGYAVFIAEGPDDATVARARAVTLGPVSGSRVALTNGVADGERVVVTGASLVLDGEPIRVIPGEEK